MGMKHEIPWLFLGYLVGSVTQKPSPPSWFLLGGFLAMGVDLVLVLRCKERDGRL